MSEKITMTPKKLRDFEKMLRKIENCTSIDDELMMAVTDGCRDVEFYDITEEEAKTLKKKGFKVKKDEQVFTKKHYIPSKKHKGLFEEVIKDEETEKIYLVRW